MPTAQSAAWVLGPVRGPGGGPGSTGLEARVLCLREGPGWRGRQGNGEPGVGRSPCQGVSSGALTVTESALSHTLPGSSGGAVGRDARCPQRWGPQGLDPRAVLRSL